MAFVAALKEAIASGELPAVRAAQFELLIDQTLGFDLQEEDGTLSVRLALKWWGDPSRLLST